MSSPVLEGMMSSKTPPARTQTSLSYEDGHPAPAGLSFTAEPYEEKLRRYERCLERIPLLTKEINEAGDRAFASALSFTEWLCEPTEALGGQVPVDAILTGEGRRRVTSILGIMAHTGRKP